MHQCLLNLERSAGGPSGRFPGRKCNFFRAVVVCILTVIDIKRQRESPFSGNGSPIIKQRVWGAELQTL